MRKLLLTTTFCGFFVMSGVTGYAEEETSRGVSAKMEEVVVTATKTEEKRGDIPNSVIIKDEMDIRESTAESLGELLSNELGIDWRTYGNYGGASEEIHIRGMGADGTQVFVNGINVNSSSLGTANLGKIPLNNIERIELVKGSGSLLYGTGAMGGTINIITKGPQKDKMNFAASAGYGTNNTYQLSAEQGMFLVGDLGYYLTASRRETDGFRDNSDLTHNDVSLKIVLDKGDNLGIDLYGDYLERRYGLPAVKPPAGTKDYFIGGEKFYNNESAKLLDRGGDKDGHFAFNVRSRPMDWLGLNLRQSYTDMEGFNYTRNAAALFPKLAGEGQKTWVTNQVAVTEGNIDIRAFDGANLLLGGEYRGYDYRRETLDIDTSGGDKPGTEVADSNHIFTRGAFAEGQYRPNEYFKILLGVRHESHSTFGSETLPRYGLVINPVQDTVLKLSRGKHFKAPTLNDLYWPDDGWSRGNPALKPEKGWHSDATLEQQLFNGLLFITGSYFKWDIKDKIAWAENPNFPTVFPGVNKWTPSNVDTQEGSGWELGAKIGPVHSMVLALNYTYLDVIEQKTGGPRRRALYTPKDEFKGDLTYWFDIGLTATATVRYVSERPAYYLNDKANDPQNTLDSYWTADLKLEYALYENWIVSLRGNNIFDEEYDTYTQFFTDQSTGTTTREGYPGAGRSVFLNLTYEY